MYLKSATVVGSPPQLVLDASVVVLQEQVLHLVPHTFYTSVFQTSESQGAPFFANQNWRQDGGSLALPVLSFSSPCPWALARLDGTDGIWSPTTSRGLQVPHSCFRPITVTQDIYLKRECEDKRMEERTYILLGEKGSYKWNAYISSPVSILWKQK